MRLSGAAFSFVLLVSLAAASATAEELQGRVAAIGPGQVTIEVAGDLLPRPGDAVSILTEVPGVGPQPVRGDWTVARVTEESVVAEPATADAGEPQPGDAVVIHSAEPQRRDPVPPLDQIGADDPRAVSLIQRGCDQGQAEHCNALGFAYQNGKGGLESNAALGASFYRKACEAGLGQGCANLATMYASGEGVPKSPDQAADYFARACSGGLTLPCAIVESYRAVPRQIGTVKKRSTADFLKLVGLSYGDKAKHVQRLFGDPDRVMSRNSTQLGYNTPEHPDLSVLYDQKSGRVEAIFVECRALPWLSQKLGSRSLLDDLCTHRSLIIARYGSSLSQVGDEIEYKLPKQKGRVRIVCPDERLNLCQRLNLHWWFKR